MELIPKFQNKGKLPTMSRKDFDKKMSDKTTVKSDTTSKVSSGRTSVDAKKDRKMGTVLQKPIRSNPFTQASYLNSPWWETEAREKAAAEEEAYQKDVNQPYYTTHRKPTKEQWRQAQQRREVSQGTITPSRKVSPVVGAINNYVGEARHRAQDGSILLKGKYTIPAIAIASLTPAMLSAPLTTAVSFGTGYLGGKAIDIPLKLTTGKTWAQNVSDLTGLVPEASGFTNPGTWIGGGLPFMSKSVRNFTSAGDQFVKNTTRDIMNHGFKEAGNRAVETYFPAIENWTFNLPYKTQERLYPLRQYVNYKIIYPRENARFSAALDRIRMDPALQGKPSVNVDLDYIGGHNASIGIGSPYVRGGLRSFRAALNPGMISEAERETVKTAMKRAVLREWNKNKQPGDIITGDAFGEQDPINTIYNLNLRLEPYRYRRLPGLSSDSYALIHNLARRGTGRVVYGREPMGVFNPLAEDGIIFDLQKQYASGAISPMRYAVEAENYFRNNGVKIRQPYVLNKPVPQYPTIKQQVLFPHPSYVEGLSKYMK